ncbi:hypothetical protein BJ508DRAFT_413981 [Ascobolus immersus RN42]|uniref:Zn(2)-C6 fungal-type domain-containing protein n=1 Tax=Ascobolus immersus RN42 TaxID=1160509 RepID=A0A3N4IF94_ASCIM|nr:hypothetical protein BJ508DRAFT_413981 [Ascobolus immersus RN42]
MSTPQGPGLHSSQHSYHSTTGREKAAPLNLGKERIGLAKTTDNISPYPSPPMSESSGHQERGSPNHHEDERSNQRLSLSSLPRVHYAEGYRDGPAASVASSHQHPRSSILHPPLIHPTPVSASSIARTQQHILSSSAPVSNSPFSIQQQPVSQAPPKKPKSHVPSACVHCKKAHLGCGVERPCQRCISLGKQDTCHDVPHKKRGRPRLKESSTHSFEISRSEAYRPLSEAMSPRNIGGAPYSIGMTPLPPHGLDSSFHPSQQPSMSSRQYVRPTSQRSRLDSLNPVAGLLQTRSRAHSDPPRELLLAILTPDLIFLKCTPAVMSIYGIDDGRMGQMSLVDLAPANKSEIDGLYMWLQSEMQRRGRFQRLEVREGREVAENRTFEEWSECNNTAMKYYFQLDLLEGRQRTRVSMMCAIVPAKLDQYIVVANFRYPPPPPVTPSTPQYFSQYSPALPSPILSPHGSQPPVHRHSLPTEFPSATSPGLSSPGMSGYSLRTLPSPLPPRMSQSHPTSPPAQQYEVSDPSRPRTSPSFKLEQPPAPRSAQQPLASSGIQLPPIRHLGAWEPVRAANEEVASVRSETSEDENPRKRNRIAVSEVMNP